MSLQTVKISTTYNLNLKVRSIRTNSNRFDIMHFMTAYLIDVKYIISMKIFEQFLINARKYVPINSIQNLNAVE